MIKGEISMVNNIQRYWFRPHIYACVINRKLVLLDLENDVYIFINSEELSRIAPYIVSPLFKSPANSDPEPDLYLVQSILDRMREKDIITADISLGKVLEAPNVASPRSFFEELQTSDWPKIKWHHILLAIISGIHALILMKVFSLSSIINSINRINPKHNRVNHEFIIELSRIYYQLRPFLPKSRVCLYDTLSFFHFCKFYGIRPQVVFGVSPEPFEAHCWAQIDDIILNDTPQYVNYFTPIMAI